MGFFKKLFDPTAGEIKRLQKIVDKIDSFEEAHKRLTDSELRDKTAHALKRAKRLTSCCRRRILSCARRLTA